MTIKILAIDTSSIACSVALLHGTIIDELSSNQDRQQSQMILEMIDTLLARNQFTVADLDLLAYAHGPGSFTGLRVGASVIQGLSYAHQKPVVGVSTLQMMAQSAYRLYQETNVLVALDARMHEVYWGIYRLNSALNIMQSVLEDSVAAPDQVILPKENKWFGIGNGWTEYMQPLQQHCLSILKEIALELKPEAKDLLPFAIYEFNQEKFLQAHEVIPVYLRNNVAVKSK